MGISCLYPNRPSHTQDHLRSVLRHCTLFPVLETVHTVGFLVDTCTDQLTRDVFIWWMEKFKEQGLDMQDGEGIVWLHTDPADGKQEIVAQDEIVAENHASLVHNSDAEEVKSAKGVSIGHAWE
ncbi:uncharacterized protein C8Q71DRAFT_720928 [Rhodofomes roseus]|nr:uncharacterized protein C8Q71DRAFT_720928 [Rhodofomes roseus]KAH9841855.1 hypothetical protein C8Q71DRAFT_720928 [Rhodofomes roseus]